uniref:PedR n=1 Tax=symbiont bacterium of Paederus fuscipes TaxID=176282 RepID=Q5I685_UNCXX|nr:PedR [symbiont bacterium of Paederus fuscipes]
MFANVPLTSLRSFESAARLGSFKAAAAELSVTASAVSHQIKSLESKLGVLLFHRQAKGVELTPPGFNLYNETHQYFSNLSSSLDQLRPRVDSKVLTVTTTHAFTALWLIPRIGDFYRHYPDIKVNIITSNVLIDLHRNSTIDLGIRGLFQQEASTYQLHLMDEYFKVYMPYHRNPSEDTHRQLINVRWEPRAQGPFDWPTWCKAAGHEDWLEHAILREYDDEHYAVQAAISGYGMVLASNVLTAEYVAKGTLSPYKPEIKLPGARYVAACIPGRERHLPVKRFLDWLVHEASRHVNE